MININMVFRKKIAWGFRVWEPEPPYHRGPCSCNGEMGEMIGVLLGAL